MNTYNCSQLYTPPISSHKTEVAAPRIRQPSFCNIRPNESRPIPHTAQRKQDAHMTGKAPYLSERMPHIGARLIAPTLINTPNVRIKRVEQSNLGKNQLQKANREHNNITKRLPIYQSSRYPCRTRQDDDRRRLSLVHATHHQTTPSYTRDVIN